MKGLRQITLILILLSLAGCSAIDWAYNNAPSFVANEFEDAFDLSDEQSEMLKSRLQSFFAWHRSEELPQYRELLDRAAADAGDGFSSTEFIGLVDSIRDAYRRSMARMIDDVGDLALTLTPQQLDHYDAFVGEIFEERDEYFEKSPQQRDIYRAERKFRRIEEWYGSFDDALEQKTLARLEQVPDLYAPWIEYRKAQHQALVDVLRDGGEPDALRKELWRVMLGDDTAYARAFEPERQVYWQQYAAAMVEIDSWVSATQRQKVIARLQKYARAASRLIASS